MKRFLALTAAILLALAANAQVSRSTTRTNAFGEQETTYYDSHGRKIGSSITKTNAFGEQETRYKDSHGVGQGKSTTRKNAFGDTETKYRR